MEKEELLEIFLKNRSFEIEHFWKRSNFYWLIVGAAFAGYVAVGDCENNFKLLISSFGLMASAVWMFGNSGSKWWMKNWEEKVRIKGDELGVDIFTPLKADQISAGPWHSPALRYSVTRVTIILSEFVSVLWLVIFVYESLKLANVEISKEISGLVVSFLTVFFLMTLAIGGRGRD